MPLFHTLVAFLVSSLSMLTLIACAGANRTAARAAPASQPAAPQSAAADDDIRQLRLIDWQPTPMLVVERTPIARLAVPAIDVHTHLHRVVDVAAEVARMDTLGIETMINLHGYSGEALVRELERFDRAHPGRFVTYAHLDLTGVGEPGWGQRVATQLAADFEAGAGGLKIFKELGLTVHARDGRRITLDDPELDAVWKTCARYRRPVLWHVADPVAFFVPLDARNERWHELQESPDWSFADRSRFPTRAQLFEERNRVLARHPDVTFVGAHMGSSSEDLGQLGAWLDRYPNFHVDLAASVNELGRQPYKARRFLIRYQDRILFGTDLKNASAPGYEVYTRFLETEDEYFGTEPANGRQGFWMIYGMYLPRPVLQKIYRDNARRLLRLETPEEPPAR